jgi:D-arabinose 1-dehydrogenase-like Zn-dependent alcohol dehydrogenase
VQFAVKMGFRTVAIARSLEKGELARELGAHHYIDSMANTLDFAALQGIKPVVEVLPLEKAADGYQRMMANQARFRVVLTTVA